jgi:hypothetical protein
MKVQEALTRPGMLEHFMGNESAIWGADAIDFTPYVTYIRGKYLDGNVGARVRGWQCCCSA